MARPGIDSAEADAVLQELRRRTDEDNRDSFHRYELDAENRLKNLFWADADSRLDYAFHGDVVVFDTTYRANKHGAAFVPFVGLSRHRTPVVFGCGVISDPSSLDSYVWLLRSFVLSAAAKEHRPPKSVITDGGDAVSAAVRIVFSDSSHRICSWHVERAADEHLHGSPPAARDAFMSLARDAADCTPAEFEERWRGFVAAHGDAANWRWLDAMYAKRELWAAAFIRDGFFLGMASDQRTECLATSLHAGLREGMSLRGLVAHADACAHALRRDVAALDVEADRSRVELATAHRDLEENAARRFTPANFYLLREEIVAVDGFEVVKTMARGHPIFGKKVYVVGFRQRWGMFFYVECSGGDAVKCSCRKMEREGLPCRHIFCMMVYNNMSRIPDCCVLRRMRRRGDTKAERLDEMNELGRQVFDLASEDAQEFKEIKEFFEGWLEERRTSLRRSGAIAAVADTVTSVTKRTKLIES